MSYFTSLGKKKNQSRIHIEQQQQKKSQTAKAVLSLKEEVH